MLSRVLNRSCFIFADFSFFLQSSEMISMATFLSNHLSIVRPSFTRSGDRARGKACPTPTLFSQANAENTQLPSRSFDLVTIMYAFHEAPKQGREKILKEAHRLLQPGGTLAVIDICTDYKPSKSMLAGEPYGTSILSRSRTNEIVYHCAHDFCFSGSKFLNTKKISTSNFAHSTDSRG